MSISKNIIFFKKTLDKHEKSCYNYTCHKPLNAFSTYAKK